MDSKDKFKIVVPSCDKNKDLFEIFHFCLEKNWPNHPEVIYSTETIANPYYKTICKDYPLDKWTVKMRETLQEVDCDKVLLIIDDLFIREPVDTKRLDYAADNLKGNIACFNLEKQFDPNDLDTDVDGFKMRNHNAPYEVSLMCGLWDKNKLIHILDRDCDPWNIELVPDNKGYDFYINSQDYIVDWGYRTFKPTGVFKGKWMRETVDYLTQLGLQVDTSRGFYD